MSGPVSVFHGPSDDSRYTEMCFIAAYGGGVKIVNQDRTIFMLTGSGSLHPETIYAQIAKNGGGRSPIPVYLE